MQEKQTSARNNTIDILRLAASFAIIVLHNFSGSGYAFSEELVALSRFAVPLFFMFSGFFAAGFDRARERRQIIRILVITVLANIAYLLLGMLDAASPALYLRDIFTTRHFVEFFMYNESPVATHLWFLSALLYCLIADYFISRRAAESKAGRAALWCAASVLLFGGLVWYHIRLAKNPWLQWFEYRNFCFFALPFFLFGRLLRGTKVTRKRLHPAIFAALFLLLEAAAVLEYRLIGVREIYLASIALVFTMFVFAMTHPAYNAGRVTQAVANAGRKYSLAIYIVHMRLLGWAQQLFYAKVPYPLWGKVIYLVPVAVFAASFLTAAAYVLVKRLVLRAVRAQRKKPEGA